MRGKIDIPELLPVLEKAGIDEVRYHHISEKLRGLPGAPATCCVLFKGGERVTDSYSALHPKDQFCRRTGRIVSLRRAVHSLDLKQRRQAK